MRYSVKNTSSSQVKVSIMGSLANTIGNHGQNFFGNVKTNANAYNSCRDEDGIRGLYYSIDEEDTSLNYGSMALTTENDQATYKTYW